MIGVCMSRNKMNDVLGDFTVFTEIGRNFLYHKDNQIAECVNGDYKERYGSIEGWIKSIEKRETKRIDKIEEQITNLNDEMRERTKILVSCESVLES